MSIKQLMLRKTKIFQRFRSSHRLKTTKLFTVQKQKHEVCISSSSFPFIYQVDIRNSNYSECLNYSMSSSKMR